MTTIVRSKLSPQQDKLWSDTRAALIWHCPAFSHIFYTMLQNTGDQFNAVFTEDPKYPVAATDGSNLIFNTGPDGYFAQGLNQRVFIAAHEILHCIFNHCGISYMLKMRGKVAYPDGKSLPFDAEQMNYAEDLVINAILVESKVGIFPTDKAGQQMGVYDAAIATSADNALDTYRKIFKQSNKGKGGGPGAGGGFDVHLDPGTSTGQDAQSANNNRNPAQWDTEVQAGISAAKAMGKLPAELLRALSEVLTPKVDWREHIKSLFARKVGSGTFDWARPDRRLITRDIYAPGRSGFGAGTVVVGVDTSGSVGPKELDMFMAEVSGILEEIRPKRLVIVWCDAAVNRVDECEDASDLMAIRRKGAPGGGGTSFIPVFDRIDKDGLSPEALVYLTDGLGSFPRAAPSFPVIWGNIYGDGKQYPWGDVVNIPKQAKD